MARTRVLCPRLVCAGSRQEEMRAPSHADLVDFKREEGRANGDRAIEAPVRSPNQRAIQSMKLIENKLACEWTSCRRATLFIIKRAQTSNEQPRANCLEPVLLVAADVIAVDYDCSHAIRDSLRARLKSLPAMTTTPWSGGRVS